MNQELKDLLFKHTLASGRIVRLKATRQPNSKPSMMADSVAGLSTNELVEYTLWRTKVVDLIFESLTEGEQNACAAYGVEVLKKSRKVRG